MPKFTATVVFEIEHDNGDYTKYERTATQTYRERRGAWTDLSSAVVDAAAKEIRKAVAEDYPPTD